jgi:hypothetical protein
MDSECDIETIKRRAIKASALDMEDERNIAPPSVGRDVKGAFFDTRHGHTTLQLQFSK